MGQVLMDVRDGVASLALDAPPVNALDRTMLEQLDAQLARCADDPRVRVVLVHGVGTRAFSAGSNLDELQSLIDRGREALAHKFAQDNGVFGRLAALSKPTVAAIEGVAAGGGLELAVCCDFVVAARDAKFSLPEIRLGAFPGSGGTVRVTQRIGAARARRMMLLGDSIASDTAYAWGLVDELCDHGDALVAAGRLADRLARGPAQALVGCKHCIAAAVAEPEGAALELAQRWAVELGFSNDLDEGLRAFRERRPPRFTGVA